MNHLAHRLRCRYPIGPVVDGEPEFGWREFSGPAPVGMVLPSPLMLEAAAEIDSLRAALVGLVGTDDPNELRSMEATLLLMQVLPLELDAIRAINAIRALLGGGRE